MEWYWVMLFIVGGLVVVMMSAMPVAICFVLINIIGVFIYWGGPAGFSQLILSLYSSIGTFNLLPVPMFILMGELMFISGLGMSVVDALDKWLGHVPGRLGLLTIAAGTLLATTSGSSIASTAMLGSILAPEMEKRGYKKSLSLGTCMASGGLAMMIPPSSLIVVLASIGDISVGKLLIGGIIPGLLLALSYVIYVVGRSLLQPSIAPSYSVEHVPLSDKLSFLARDILPLGLIIFLVIGVIFIGVATPTEAAALGALGCLILAALHKKLKWLVVKDSVMNTVKISVMVLIILTGASAFSQILSFSGVNKGILELITNLPVIPIFIFIAIQVILLILGLFMGATAIMMITLPIFMPIVYAMDWNPVWFGLAFLINIEIGQLTPPFGMLLFTMAAVAPKGTTMQEIITASLPFLICDLIVLAIISAFPSLALWLPNLVSG